MDPKLLLMDEPFGALDEQTRNVLEHAVEMSWQEEKKTDVVGTHSIREAIKLSDRVLIMGARPGTIIEDVHIDLHRPRKQAEMASLEEKMFLILKAEINKVMREELENASNY